MNDKEVHAITNTHVVAEAKPLSPNRGDDQGWATKSEAKVKTKVEAEPSSLSQDEIWGRDEEQSQAQAIKTEPRWRWSLKPRWKSRPRWNLISR